MQGLLLQKYTWVPACARLCGSQKSILVPFFIDSHLFFFFFFETDSLPKPAAQLSVRLSGQRAPRSCLSLPFPSTEVTACTAMTSFAVAAKDLRLLPVP